MSEHYIPPSNPDSGTDVEPPEELLALTDEELLAFTQRERLRIARAITGSPSVRLNEVDPKLLNVALKAMSDASSVVMAKKRMDVDAGTSDANMALAKSVTSLFMRNDNHNPFEVKPDLNDERSPPVINTSLVPEAVLALGETDIGVASTNYEQFSKEE